LEGDHELSHEPEITKDCNHVNISDFRVEELKYGANVYWDLPTTEEVREYWVKMEDGDLFSA